MPIKCTVKKNTYYDSIQLMRIASDIARQPGIRDIAVLMGTGQNKTSIENGELYIDEVKAATANDLFIVVSADDEQTAAAAVAQAEEMIVNTGSGANGKSIPEAYSLASALEQQPGTNIALFSLAGGYVRTEADKALDDGLHLMIFSDNVELEDEIALKKRGREEGRLVMGPDCGTAIINGAKLAFANEVRRGRIGVVGASGTGIQEVTCLVHDLGEGISHAIGTGSRDVKAAVGGIMTVEGLNLLAADPGTEVIAVVSKTPEAPVMPVILEAAVKAGKPVVITCLGGRAEEMPQPAANVCYAFTLEEAAVLAVALLQKKQPEEVGAYFTDALEALQKQAAETPRAPEQKYVRGLFCGGTFTGESAAILAGALGEACSNAGAPGVQPMADVLKSSGHTCLDMGDDVFTQGKPHPMIEPYLRHKRILEEAADPECAVLLFDVLLGYGSHADPAGVLCESLAQVRRIAAEAGRTLPVVAYLCGVEGDFQNYGEQKQKLLDAGCILAPSSQAAARLAASYAKGGA